MLSQVHSLADVQTLTITSGEKLRFKIGTLSLFDSDKLTYLLHPEVKSIGIKRYHERIEVFNVANAETFRQEAKRQCQTTIDTEEEGTLDYYLVILSRQEVNHIMVLKEDGFKEVTVAIGFLG